jgi:hypothetical protein
MLEAYNRLPGTAILAVNGHARYGQSFLLVAGCSYGRDSDRNDLAHQEVHTTANCRWQRKLTVIFALCCHAIRVYYRPCVACGRTPIECRQAVAGDNFP